MLLRSWLDLYVLVTRLPPTSTLFPYTTLFRSPPFGAAGRLPGRSTRDSRQQHHRGPGAAHPPARHAAQLSLARDRKSTRLNSSHVAISYAVFCLKKKRHKHDVG